MKKAVLFICLLFTLDCKAQLNSDTLPHPIDLHLEQPKHNGSNIELKCGLFMSGVGYGTLIYGLIKNRDDLTYIGGGIMLSGAIIMIDSRKFFNFGINSKGFTIKYRFR